MTEEEMKVWKQRIDEMSQVQLASLQRFAPIGHDVFATPELYSHFQERFKAKGGMTPQVSKLIGWGAPKP